MNIARYTELSYNKDAKLTQSGLDAGWFFCSCEWDGMLLHKTDPEAEVCGCFGPKADKPLPQQESP